MQRVPNAGFSPELEARLKQLWGNPVNLYRALGNHPGLAAAWTEFANSIRHDSRTPRALALTEGVMACSVREHQPRLG